MNQAFKQNACEANQKHLSHEKHFNVICVFPGFFVFTKQ